MLPADPAGQGPAARVRRRAAAAGSDNAVAAEAFDIRGGVAERAQHLVRCAWPSRGDGANGHRGRRHPDRRADVGHATQLGVVGVDDHLAM